MIVAWWIVGALTGVPLLLAKGEMVLVIEQAQLMSLLGHVVFSVVAALLVHFGNRR